VIDIPQQPEIVPDKQQAVHTPSITVVDTPPPPGSDADNPESVAVDTPPPPGSVPDKPESVAVADIHKPQRRRAVADDMDIADIQPGSAAAGDGGIPPAANGGY